MIRKFFVSAALMFGVLAAATAADAAIIKATYIGTVSSGFDDTHTFGTATTDLSGSSYKIVYTIDDTKGVNLFNVPGVGSAIGGGAGDTPPTSSPVSADVTINGITVHLNGVYGSSISQSAVLNWIAETTFSLDIIDLGHATEAYTLSQIYPNSLGHPVSWDFHTPFFHVVQPGDIASTHAEWDYVDIVAGTTLSWSADMAVTSVEITGVPEPATLALFGAALVGAARQRRRAKLG